MRFLSKIRERQFAKNGGTYNLSRAVLAGVLAAGCLMPGFAEAAVLVRSSGVNYTQDGNIATINNVNGNNVGTEYIFWWPGDGDTVKDCTINVNSVTIGPKIDIYGGYTNSDRTVTGNKVTIKDTMFTSNSRIYGGSNLSSGDVTGNKVEISGNTKFNEASEIYGGYSEFGTANLNSVSITGGTINGSVYGGHGNTSANNNSVSISGGTLNLGDVRGGYSESDTASDTANDNRVSISVGTFTGLVSGGYSKSGEANYNEVSISGGKFNGRVYGGWGKTVANENSVSIRGGEFNNSVYGGYAESNLNTADNRANDNQVSISGGEFNGDVYGGMVDYNSGEANNNIVSINGGTFNGYHVCGGYTDKGAADYNQVSIDGGTFYGYVVGGWADSDGTANNNQVSINGGTFNDDISGGYTDKGAADYNQVSINGGTFNGYVVSGVADSDGTANNNQVIISDGTFNDDVSGGCSYSGEAYENQVIISGGTFNANVYGGESYDDEANKTAHDNKVILVGEHAKYPLSAEQTIDGSDHININGTVYGGTHSGNEIHVYGSKINVGHIANFNKLHFFIDNTLTFGETMLTINGMSGSGAPQMFDTDPNDTNVTISKDNLAVKVTGKPQASGDKNTITLIHNESDKITYSNDITKVPVEIGKLLTGEGSVDLVNNDKDLKDLVLTLNVEKSTVNENGKSLVETRAAAAFIVNNMSDFMLGQGMEQAKAAAGGVTPIDEGKLTPFAAVGGSNMRYTTGSYVDVNGWNGVVGFAKQADKLLFGVAVEHGRGNYDSYLDNGVHASGDIKSTGGVIFGEYKLDNGVHYDAALRAGRVKSDYNSTATSYDESSAYYGFSLGGGKELTVSDKATLDVYGRYYFSHTNGSDVSIATGEEIDFDAVNSHRLRIGGRYTTTLTEKSKAYAGLAWQYEFGGDAKAAINGYSAPTPSLQGHSAIVEAGYKLNAGKNLTLDFNLNGAMGKQRGIGGGIGAQWLF